MNSSTDRLRVRNSHKERCNHASDGQRWLCQKVEREVTSLNISMKIGSRGPPAHLSCWVWGRQNWPRVRKFWAVSGPGDAEVGSFLPRPFPEPCTCEYSDMPDNSFCFRRVIPARPCTEAHTACLVMTVTSCPAGPCYQLGVSGKWLCVPCSTLGTFPCYENTSHRGKRCRYVQ